MSKPLWLHHALAAALIAMSVDPSALPAQLLPVAPREHCTPYTQGAGAAQEWLDRAAARVLPSSLEGRVLRYRASLDVPLWEQSDRTYPPYIPNASVTLRWYDPATGAEGRQPVDRTLVPHRPPAQISTPAGAWISRDTTLQPVPAFTPFTEPWRFENPWIVLADWRAHAAEASVTSRCVSRDAERIVLERAGERLYLSASDAMPIELSRAEPHYLWGQVRAEYLWSTWWGVEGGGLYPIAAFRLFDGTEYERVGLTPGSAALVPADSAPALTTAAYPAAPAPSAPAAIERPDTVRVAPGTWLLVTPSYTEGVTLQRDTVFLLDATTGEARARGDSAVIAGLFPGNHPVVVVVTDLAWPHISGVRYWVSRGAAIVSLRGSEVFLRRVVERRWTLHPDALERSRAVARFRFRGVADSLSLAGGALVVHALQGTTTEGAVGVWLPEARFFWAGDYVQRGGTSPYVHDVVATIRALGLEPRTVGAQHVPLTSWEALLRPPSAP